MVNGNDVLEWEEQNTQDLEIKFLDSLTHNRLKAMLLASGDLMDKLKEDFPDEWGLFVAEQFDLRY
jgi:hypothetical protein